ncbi:hypothetical protein BBJ28_00017275 [Nothophytophthora sp. Chile5]|nr:hypothetical protein BBJ28_00017275 [Nothophytophthora sp. Chile5]
MRCSRQLLKPNDTPYGRLCAGLKAHGGRILKPFQSNRRGEREQEFYERVFVTEKDSPNYTTLRPLLPKYYGTVVIPEPKDGETAPPPNGMHPGKYLALEDLTWGRPWPCIMDVKMGTRSFEDDASAEKIAYERQKFPLQEAVGFRIQGIKVFDPKQRQYVEFDKHFGRGITSAEALASAFRNFFPPNDKTKAAALLQAAWFQEQQDVEFIASSFLFLYNGEPTATAEDLPVADAADIRLIDFAHVTHPSPGQRDEGVLTGIATLIQCFRELLQDLKE